MNNQTQFTTTIILVVLLVVVRQRGRRLVKNVFVFYLGISHLFGTIKCVCRY